jgi:hypothetical protein
MSFHDNLIGGGDDDEDDDNGGGGGGGSGGGGGIISGGGGGGGVVDDVTGGVDDVASGVEESVQDASPDVPTVDVETGAEADDDDSDLSIGPIGEGQDSLDVEVGGDGGGGPPGPPDAPESKDPPNIPDSPDTTNIPGVPGGSSGDMGTYVDEGGQPWQFPGTAPEGDAGAVSPGEQDIPEAPGGSNVSRSAIPGDVPDEQEDSGGESPGTVSPGRQPTFDPTLGQTGTGLPEDGPGPGDSGEQEGQREGGGGGGVETPSPPSSLRTFSVSPTAATIALNGNIGPDTYTIRDTSTGRTWTINGSMGTLSGLEPGRTYSVKARSEPGDTTAGSYNRSPYSGTLTFSTPTEDDEEEGGQMGGRGDRRTLRPPPELPDPSVEPPREPPVTRLPVERQPDLPERQPDPARFILRRVDAPETNPINTRYTLDALVENAGGQQADFEVRAGSVSTTRTLAPGDQTSVSLTKQDPDPAVEAVTVEVVNTATGTVVDTEDVTIETTTSEFAITDVSYPSGVREGDSYSGDITVENTGPAPGTVQVDAGSYSETATLDPGATRTFTHEARNDNASEQTYTVTARNQATGQVADRTSTTVTTQRPSISVQNIEIPPDLAPGERGTARVNVTNQGNASGSARIESSNFSQTVTLSPGEFQTVPVNFTKQRGQSQDVTIRLVDPDTGTVMAERSPRVLTREADFTVRSVDAPGAVKSGSQFTINVNVANDGDGVGKAVVSADGTTKQRRIGPAEQQTVTVPVRKQGTTPQDVTVSLRNADKGFVDAQRTVTVAGIPTETPTENEPRPPQRQPRRRSPVPSPFGGDGGGGGPFSGGNPFGNLFG